MKKTIILWFLLCAPTMAFIQAEEEKRSYIVGTFLSGLGEHLGGSAFGTGFEWVSGGKLSWSTYEEKDNDMVLSWPLVFDLKLISHFGAGITFGNMYVMSMNEYYKDANHLYFGFSYVLPIKRFDIGASIIVFPIYIDNDSLVAGKIDASYWFMKDIGASLSTTIGGTTGWAKPRVIFFDILAGVSIKIGGTAKN